MGSHSGTPSQKDKLRKKKIQKIKKQIKKGIYKIDSTKISEAIIKTNIKDLK
ncbi:MAG: flagellar biosynthesis anti-sigma factor FlgM [Deltaproteobacteria bacterium]|nr:flagellar biosynthesis anti-sigma factor FlgM [Deltaproteobacteria bacterium]